MECKNCQKPLRTDFSFCPACGAKVIRNRITIKNLWHDITERYFNVDTTFLKTFRHLFSKPEVVIEGYIQGIRRRYLNPISYLGIAITLSGFLIFWIKRAGDKINFDVFGTGSTSIAQEKMMAFVFDYQSILFVLFIPLMAVAGWLCFQKKKYNFSERLVIFMYTLAHYSIATFILLTPILFFAPKYYGAFSTFGIVFMYLYSAFVIKKISLEKGIALFARILLFWTLFTILYFGLYLVIPILLTITGEISLDDFRPIKVK